MSEKENSTDTVDENEVTQPDPAVAGQGTGAEEMPDHAELVSLLEDARGKADDHWGQVVRLQADMENLRKRSERDLANAHKFALERFASELLPVKDSLEMGLAAFDLEGADSDKLREGVALTLQMLTSALDKAAISEVNPQDEPFNPDFHQAMSMQERDDVEPNTVVTVVQKGYTLNGRLIRPAMVIVSKAPVSSS
ncbi:MAG: nucleotide exchange factor GrpE [Gammaproteobacteria bacterium]|jgi:molecular chaperone GrpE|nr:nucleotide exchange factor GrpE [Gammaproteobacteria bacterium]